MLHILPEEAAGFDEIIYMHWLASPLSASRRSFFDIFWKKTSSLIIMVFFIYGLEMAFISFKLFFSSIHKKKFI